MQILKRFSLIIFLITVFSGAGFAQDDPAFKLGNRFFRDSLYNLALEQYQKYLHTTTGGTFEAEALFKTAQCYQNMNNNKMAAEKFEEYISRFPSRPDIIDAMYYAAITRRAAGDLREAGNWYFSVWSKYAGSVRARNSLFEAARAFENVPDIDRSVKLYETYLKRFPETENAKKVVISLTDLFVNAKEYQQAERVLKLIVPKNDDKSYMINWKYRIALLNWKMQKQDEALPKFQELFSILTIDFPDFEKIALSYLSILKETKKYFEAMAVFERIDGFYKSRGQKDVGYDFYKDWAICSKKANDWNSLLKLSKELLGERYKNQINIFEINYQVAEAYIALQDFPRAVETLRFVEANDTTDVYALKAVRKSAELYLNKGLYLSAISAYRRYLQFDKTKDRDVVLFKIGKIFQEKYRKYDAALREFDNLMKWYPSSSYHVRAVYAAAQCQEELKDYKMAAANYRYVSETGSDEEIVKSASSRAAYINDFLIKDSENAAYKLTLLLEDNIVGMSENERLKRLASVYEEDLKEYEKALEIYDKILKSDSSSSQKYSDIILRKAIVFENLSRKAEYNGTVNTNKFAVSEAIKLYDLIVAEAPDSKEAAEAAYRVLKLKDNSISAYEEYLAKYPQSKYCPEIIIKLSANYKRKNDTESIEKSIALYNRIINEFSGSNFAAEALSGVAGAYLKKGDIDNAAIAVQKFRDTFKNTNYDAEIYFISGLVSSKKGENDKAIEQFKEALYRYPYSYLSERLRYELAEAEFASNKIFDALNSYQVYLQDYPDGKKVLKAKYGLGLCYIGLGKNDEAVALFTELLSAGLSAKVNNLMRYELGKIEEERGETFKALGNYRAILKNGEFEKAVDVHKRMGKLYFDSRVFNKAAVSYSDLISVAENSDDSAFAMCKAAVSFIMSGDRKKSDKIIKEFKDQFETKYQDYFVEIIFHEGLHLSVEKEYDKAINRFKFILQKFDSSIWADDAAYEIALADFYLNDTETALKLFSDFPVSYPTSDLIASSLFKKGMIYFGMSDYLKAATAFDEAMNHHSVSDDVKFRAAGNAASAYQKASSWLKAADAYALMLRDFPGKIHISSYHLKRGFCLIQAGKTSDALEEFLKAQVDPIDEDKPEIHYWIATSHSKLGDLDKAIAEYLKVPYQYANAGKWGVTSEFEAARLYERQGKYSEAMTLYNKIIRSDGEHGRFGRRAQERVQILKNIGG